MTLPIAILLFGGSAWLGFDKVFGFIPKTLSMVGVSETTVRQSGPWKAATNVLPGLGKEFMPPLDEGSFLYMPTTMPHASIGEALDVLQLQNQLLVSIPEVESVVGKIGRADTPLDPAPVSMLETYITYKSEYKTDQNGHRLNFRYDNEADEFIRDDAGELVPDPGGRPFRQWRDEIRKPDDIWQAITTAAQIPGTTSAPKLQPIAARIVMLQSGMRAPMGMKVKGPDLETIERVALELESLLKQIPTVQSSAVIADRIVGKPYLEIDIDRDAIKRYGLHIRSVQDVIEVAIGGRQITTTVEGRERFPSACDTLANYVTTSNRSTEFWSRRRWGRRFRSGNSPTFATPAAHRSSRAKTRSCSGTFCSTRSPAKRKSTSSRMLRRSCNRRSTRASSRCRRE